MKAASTGILILTLLGVVREGMRRATAKQVHMRVGWGRVKKGDVRLPGWRWQHPSIPDFEREPACLAERGLAACGWVTLLLHLYPVMVGVLRLGRAGGSFA